MISVNIISPVEKDMLMIENQLRKMLFGSELPVKSNIIPKFVR